MPIMGLEPVVSNGAFAVYRVNPPQYPGDWWEAFMVGLKYRAFGDGEGAQIKDGGPKGDDAESWFKVKYGEIAWTSQISVVQ